MSKNFTKAVYKPDPMSSDEYMILIGNTEAAEKWKNGDRSIPLVRIVDSFDVFHTGQGATGIMQRTSKQTLDTVFGTTNEDEVVEQILTQGQIKTSPAPHKWTSTNDQRSGGYQVSTGATSLGHGGR